jgi:Cu2+-exporting ATPase
MTHSYNITGMSCNGCRTTVENALITINGVEAKVSLDPPVATITMENHVSTELLQEALTKAGNYSIAMVNTSATRQETH